MNNPNYYAILPANVRYDKNLKAMEKILYAEITALSNKNGYCSASNPYFAKLYEKSNETISRWISHLEKEGYLKVIIDAKKGNKRAIYPIDKKINTIDENVNTLLTKKSIPIDENVKHNNINTILQENNNTSKNKKEPVKEENKTKTSTKKTNVKNSQLVEEKKEAIQKLMDLIRDFYKEKNLSLTGNKVFKYQKTLYDLLENYSLEDIEEVIKFGMKDKFYSKLITIPSSLFNNFESMKLALEEQEEPHFKSALDFYEINLPKGWIL